VFRFGKKLRRVIGGKCIGEDCLGADGGSATTHTHFLVA